MHGFINCKRSKHHESTTLTRKNPRIQFASPGGLSSLLGGSSLNPKNMNNGCVAWRAFIAARQFLDRNPYFYKKSHKLTEDSNIQNNYQSVQLPLVGFLAPKSNS